LKNTTTFLYSSCERKKSYPQVDFVFLRYDLWYNKVKITNSKQYFSAKCKTQNSKLQRKAQSELKKSEIRNNDQNSNVQNAHPHLNPPPPLWGGGGVGGGGGICLKHLNI